MAKPFNPDLTKYWKICLPATLAGTVELYLMDNIHKKPKYGSRAELISSLLNNWILRRKAGLAEPSAVRAVAEAISEELSLHKQGLDWEDPNGVVQRAAVRAIRKLESFDNA